jgi:proprotein convertase subtilisin/kexin type 5
LTCSGSQSSQCTSCDTTSKFPYLQYHSCASSCSPGFYLAQNISQCLSCYDACLSCTSSSELACLSCKIGYIYISDTHCCEKHTGKPFYIDSKTGETHNCHDSCIQCRGPNPNDCIACNSMTEVLLEDGHCVNECPLGSYMSENNTIEIETNICLSCSMGCKQCTNINQCSQCDEANGYKLQGQQCIPTCAAG